MEWSAAKNEQQYQADTPPLGWDLHSISIRVLKSSRTDPNLPNVSNRPHLLCAWIYACRAASCTQLLSGSRTRTMLVSQPTTSVWTRSSPQSKVLVTMSGHFCSSQVGVDLRWQRGTLVAVVQPGHFTQGSCSTITHYTAYMHWQMPGCWLKLQSAHLPQRWALPGLPCFRQEHCHHVLAAH